MRHGKKINHLSRKSAHRKALLANLASSLILHKRISTTVAKAKALRRFVEPLITKAKSDTTHSRRIVFSYLKHKEPVKELFDNIANKIADRPGGYTRIIRTGYRLGDNAETCIMELVDYNEIYVKDDRKKATRRRTRRGPAKKETSQVQPAAREESNIEEIPSKVVQEFPEVQQESSTQQSPVPETQPEQNPDDNSPESSEASSQEDSKE